MATTPPLAFLSYSTQDDAHEGGKLRAFAERLSGEVRFQSGEEFPIFVHRNDLKWGQEWRSRIEESLGATTFLIPILTPQYLNRVSCRKELLLFVEREKKSGRTDLILPVYYATCPKIENPEKGGQDELAQLLRTRQYKDWRTLRHSDWTKPKVTRQFEQMALDIVAALERKAHPAPAGVRDADKQPGKRRSILTLPELEQAANKSGQGELYRAFIRLVPDSFIRVPNQSFLSLDARLPDGRRETVLNIDPRRSSAESGLLYRLFLSRIANLKRVSEHTILKGLPGGGESWKPSSGNGKGWAGSMRNLKDVQNVINALCGMPTLS